MKKINLFKREKKEKPAGKKQEDASIDIAVKGGATRRPSKKQIAYIACGVLLVAVVVGVILFITARKNDGARIAAKLSDHIGASLYTAAGDADVDLNANATCTYLNETGDFAAVCESKKITKVGGVKVPEWAIYCYSDTAGNLSQVSYYDYSLLEDEPVGQKTKRYVLLTDIVKGMHLENALDAIDLDPFCISYFSNGAKQYQYKYCYKDSTTKDLLAYTITVLFDGNGNVITATDSQNKFVVDYLTVQ